MITPAKLMIGLAAAAALSTPALAQPGRTGQVANEIARGIRDTAEAIGTVSDALYQGVNGVRYRGAERYAIDVCRPRVERYGLMRVETVQPYGRRSFRVYGTTDPRASYYDRSRWGRGYSPRSFTCTVRDDGRVKVKTRRLRY
jgi:hypothetical protein